MIRSRLIPAVALWALMAVPAHAQPAESGGIASLIVSGATVEEDVSLGIAGAIGYRFNRTLGFTLELTSLPSFSPDIPEAVPSPIQYTIAAGGTSVPGGAPISSVIFPTPVTTFGDQDAHATIFTANLRLEVPTDSRRFLPYVVGGAGVANVNEEFTVTTRYPPNILTPSLGAIFPVPPIEYEVSQSSTNMAVTFGGGLGVRTTDHMSIDADLRYLAVFGSRDLQIGRFGVGVSYRF